MVGPQQRSIKKAQKEALLLREISQLFHQIMLDDSRITDLFINRVQLSPDKGMCTVFFYSPLGREHFEKIMPLLILYKPSLRTAIAHKIQSRYTPEIKFRFDDQFEKQQRIETLLEKIKTEEPS